LIINNGVYDSELLQENCQIQNSDTALVNSPTKDQATYQQPPHREREREREKVQLEDTCQILRTYSGRVMNKGNRIAGRRYKKLTKKNQP
jgi:hypothetical protein